MRTITCTLSEQTCRALEVRAAWNDRHLEREIEEILEHATRNRRTSRFAAAAYEPSGLSDMKTEPLMTLDDTLAMADGLIVD